VQPRLHEEGVIVAWIEGPRRPQGFHPGGWIGVIEGVDRHLRQHAGEHVTL